MTDTEILTAAVEKVVENGYCPTDSGLPVVEVEGSKQGMWFYDNTGTATFWYTHQLIFDHSFAKAFWNDYNPKEAAFTISDEKGGETENTDHFTFMDLTGLKAADYYICGRSDTKTNVANSEWEFQLQQLVLEEDPIKYLQKFL